MKKKQATQAKPTRHFSGGQIKLYRQRAGMTQESAAKAAGTSRQQLTDIENGKVESPNVRTIELMARALNCDPTDFFIYGKRGGTK